MLLARRRADTFPGELDQVLARAAAGYEGQPGAVGAFEAAVRTRAGANGAVALSSGRKAMMLILRHVGVGPGDEVIVPAYTLKDLCVLIEGLGAKAVPADIDPETLNVTAESVKRRISSKTKAILVLHIFGAPCPMDELVTLAKAHDLPLVEDAAHALGASYRGLPVGALGYAGFYSFEWTKPVNTYGGGMVVSGDVDLIESIRQETAGAEASLGAVAAKVKAIQTEEKIFRSGVARLPLWLLANPLTAPPFEWLYRQIQRTPPSGAAYTPLQAELGMQKLSTLERRIDERERLVATLRARLDPTIRLQSVLPGCRSTWYFCVAILPCNAAPVRRRLLAAGIDAGVRAEIADDCAHLLGYDDCPNTEAVFARAIQVPLYEGLDGAAMDRLAEALNQAVREA